MEAKKFRNFDKRPCKFIFRNGKKVFGVIWETTVHKNASYFFTTNNEFERNKEKSKKLIGLPINIEDIIHAEILF
jgi:hypothetical protein